jgi:hypothetical protein
MAISEKDFLFKRVLSLDNTDEEEDDGNDQENVNKPSKYVES